MGKKVVKAKTLMKKKPAKKTTMKRRVAMKKSVIAKGKRGKTSVFKGTKLKTSGGLQKTDLIKSKSGKIVSKKSSAAGKKSFKRISAWTTAFKQARKSLGIKGFCPCGGKTAKGQAFLKKVRSLYKK